VWVCVLLVAGCWLLGFASGGKELDQVRSKRPKQGPTKDRRKYIRRRTSYLDLDNLRCKVTSSYIIILMMVLRNPSFVSIL
jgi:hypothetical protein